MKPQRRAPAFQFYADDFIAGTSEMSAEEVGGYIRLLCYQWSHGTIPKDNDRAARVAGIAEPCLSHALAKFEPLDDGRLCNLRLESEREKQESFRAERSESGKKGAIQRWEHSQANGSANGSAIAKPMANTMAKNSSPSPSPIGINKEGKRPTVEQAKEYALELGLTESDAEAFFDHHEATGWKLKGQPVKSWKACLRTWKRNALKFGATKPTNGSHTPKQSNLPSWKLEELLRDEINRHPANWESLKFDRSKVTPEMKDDLKALRERLISCRSGMLQ